MGAGWVLRRGRGSGGGPAAGNSQSSGSYEDAVAAEQRARERLEKANQDLQEAIQLATPEELEGYWQELPASVRELVTVKGEVSADLLTYIADDDEGRMQLLKQHGCEDVALKEKAMVLEALQLAAEDKSARLRRNRVMKRGVQMALDLAKRDKARKKEDPGKLLEGEMPTMTWLERCSGAVMMPRRRRATDPGLEDGEADAIKERESGNSGKSKLTR